jgi:hypothetical protein
VTECQRIFPSQHDALHGAKSEGENNDETYTMRSDEKNKTSILFFALLTASFVQQIEQRNSASVYAH